MDPDKLSKAIIRLVELVKRLRGPNGCPWDAEQTDSTIKVYLLEEAYEVIEAVERSSPEDVCMELGDLLFQILFLTRLAEERGEFDILEVAKNITEKMIRRHPHVFGDAEVNGPEDVAANWVRIKRQEKELSGKSIDILTSVPLNLPALLRAHRLSERAARTNFDWETKNGVWEKVQEEFKELGEVIDEDDAAGVGEELGDLLFSLVNLARHWGFNAEDLLRLANQKFVNRFQKMEKELEGKGIRLENATMEEMDKAWEIVKNRKTCIKDRGF
jgi:MazG family protein